MSIFGSNILLVIIFRLFLLHQTMAFFPNAGRGPATTGFIRGSNIVTCPLACQLLQGSTMWNRNDADKAGTNNLQIYDMDDIQGYYCQVTNAPPLPPYAQAPEGFSDRFFYIDSNNWSQGYAAGEVTEAEVYGPNPQTDYMHTAFDSGLVCSQDPPPTRTPVPPHIDPSDCVSPQSSLTWFRLKSSLFK